MTSTGALTLNDASDGTMPPSAPPLTCVSAQTDFTFELDDDEVDEYADAEEICQKFETVMAVCAIVGLVAITCVFVVADAFAGTNPDTKTTFQRRLETYKVLRGISDS